MMVDARALPKRKKNVTMCEVERIYRLIVDFVECFRMPPVVSMKMTEFEKRPVCLVTTSMYWSEKPGLA
jgi:hypothetical protein